MPIVIRLVLALAFANMSVLTGGAVAQDYPNKPIRIITAGGPDIVARIFGRKFTEAMGQPVISENIAGAGGLIAAAAVAKSRPDGYTIMNAVSSLMVVSALHKEALDQSRDFTPVASTNFLPYVLVVNPALQVNSVQEFIALARAKPGALNYSGASGTFAHLAFELFKTMAKVDIFHVPMNSAQQMMAVMSGQIDAVMINPANMIGARKSGKVVALAVTSPQRSRVVPDLPTFDECGLKGYDLVGWNGFIAPLGTPPAILAKLNGVVRQALKQPDVLKQLADTAFEPGWDFSPEQFGNFLKSEAAKWKELAGEIKVQLD